MKLEIGMYVRTDDGYIAKYDKSKHNCLGKYYGFASTIRDLRWEEYDDDCFLWESELKNIVKASYNIIDLIKSKDIILGRDGKIYQCWKIYKDYVFTYSKNKQGQTITLVDYQIDKVLTKEQMEQIAYKVGD